MDTVKEVRLTWDKETGKYSRRRKATTTAFLRGPVPMDWLAAAAALRGSALLLGTVLWHIAGMQGTRRDLPVSTERLEQFGVSRHAKFRALRSLVDAGLVTVQHKRGRSPRVTLVVGKGKGRRKPTTFSQ